MLKFLTNWLPKPLCKAFRKRGVKAYFASKRLLDILTKEISEYDVLYYARSVPPMLDKSFLSRSSKAHIPVIIGAHAPLKIDYPMRPSHFLYNLVFPPQVFLYSRSALIHVLNMDDLKYSERLGIKAAYIPLGTDVKVFRPREKDDVFTVVYSSRACWQKSTDIFVAMVKRLTKELGCRIRFRIISYGFLTTLYEEIRHYRNVEIIKRLPAKEYAKVLSGSHVLLFPSRYESFGLVVLDAFAAGLPVVAFNVRGVVRDIMLRDCTQKTYVIDYCDINAFTRRIVELSRLWYDKPELYLDLATKCRKVAERYSWSIFAKKFASLLQFVVESCAYDEP